jgi:predicted metal-dependent phosphoesterase TrpH
MRFDMHCHTKEGSIDGKVPISEYIELLKSQGFDGMLVTDHDSYNGYRKYRDTLKGKLKDFVVLKGIEYDTLDAGHILVILPEGIKLPLMECRGLPVKVLQDVVHRHGGILGPAHPCGERHLSITRTMAYKKYPDIMKNFDFIEGFNSCESPESNAEAHRIAFKYNLPMFGGSDSHHTTCVGTAFTDFKCPITRESDLITYVLSKNTINCGGEYYHGTVKGRIGIFNHILVESFWFYNRFACMYRSHKRKIAMSLLTH